MVVQAGEGTEDIIYGTTSIPAGPRTFGGYLARPDGQVEWPTVLVFGPELAPTSSIKNICRVFARHGIAALAPALDGDPVRDRQITRAIAAFIGAPNGDWSNAEYGFGVVAFEAGLGVSARLAAADDRVMAHACIGSFLDDETVDDLVQADAPGLFIASRGDTTGDVEASLAARDRMPRTTFVVYGEGDAGFWNDDADGFRADRLEDVMTRLIAFFSDTLPARL